MQTRAGFEELRNNVILKDLCTGCGACYASCPFELVLDYSEGRPELIGGCQKCGICLGVCHKYSCESSKLEEFVFGRRSTLEEVFGVSISAHVAKAFDANVSSAGQDGGAVTSLLLNAFDSGLIDGAIVSSTFNSRPWFPVPSVSWNREKILQAAGTRYSYSPSIVALKKATGEQLRKIAFVGTPCQVVALRRMQKNNLRLAKCVNLVMGLFCSKSFSYKGLVLEKIEKGLGIDPIDIEKMNIKGRMQIVLKSGKVVEIPLKEIQGYAEPFCRFCGDFSAEFADLSFGGAGLDGRTLTVIRTERGRTALNAAVKSGALELRPVDEFKNALDLLVRLSVRKRKKALNSSARLELDS